MKIKDVSQGSPRKINILLADDDKDDCLLFKEALEELPLSVQLTVVENGRQLMEQLNRKKSKSPDVLFLDLHMPGKNGFSSLLEIKLNENLQKIPVIIFSTSYDQDMLNLVYKDAAHYYIQKPSEFSQLKKVILQALTLISQKNITLPGREGFVLTGNV
jgi:CheY-like chemotaxis protein